VTPALIVAKSRWTLNAGGVTYAIDEFKGRHAGLFLAEVELDEHAPLVAKPSFAVADVSDDNEYTGRGSPGQQRPKSAASSSARWDTETSALVV